MTLIAYNDGADGAMTAPAAIADRLGTVPFAPHITLLAGVRGPEAGLLAGAGVLADGLAPLDAQPAGIDGLDQYFRCLFFGIGGSPALRDAHDRAARRFGRAPDPTWQSTQCTLACGER